MMLMMLLMSRGVILPSSVVRTHSAATATAIDAVTKAVANAEYGQGYIQDKDKNQEADVDADDDHISMMLTMLLLLLMLPLMRLQEVSTEVCSENSQYLNSDADAVADPADEAADNDKDNVYPVLMVGGVIPHRR